MFSIEIFIVTSHRVHDTIGGVEKFVILFSSWCYGRKMKVTMISRVLSPFPVKITQNPILMPKNHKIRNVKKIKLPFLLYYLGLCWFSLFTFLSLVKLIRDWKRTNVNRPSVLHAQDIDFAALTIVLIGKIFQIPIIVQQHGPLIELRPKKYMKIIERFINKIVCKFSDAIIVTDKFTAHYLLKIGVNKKKIYIIPAAVDTNYFENSKKQTLINGKDLNFFKIGYIGRLSPEKNLRTLIVAFKDLKTAGNPFKLVLVGDGDLMNDLKQLVKNLKINRSVKFTGFLTDITTILPYLDVFVLPSKTEGTPLSLLEAMAIGDTIVASDIPGIREMVRNNKEALLFDPHNPDQLKEAILKLYNNPKLRKKLGENAKRRAKRYDVNTVFPKILQVYQQTLRKNHSHRLTCFKCT